MMGPFRPLATYGFEIRLLLSGHTTTYRTCCQARGSRLFIYSPTVQGCCRARASTCNQHRHLSTVTAPTHKTIYHIIYIFIRMLGYSTGQSTGTVTRQQGVRALQVAGTSVIPMCVLKSGDLLGVGSWYHISHSPSASREPRAASPES